MNEVNSMVRWRLKFVVFNLKMYFRLTAFVSVNENDIEMSRNLYLPKLIRLPTIKTIKELQYYCTLSVSVEREWNNISSENSSTVANLKYNISFLYPH